MRVLLAEDETITRRTVERHLVSWGHEVVATADGQEAVDAYERSEFDLIISDWDMPRMAGIDVVRRVRAVEGRQFVYVMMLTGRDESDDIVEGLDAGADDYLSKPFKKDELRARLHAGERVIRIERALSETVDQLQRSQSRMKRDLDAAANLQQKLLPSHDLRHHAIRTAWRYQPCDELGGDALGFELIDDRYLVAYLLDVSGHGVPAALLSYSASQALASAAGMTATRTEGKLEIVSPDDVARALNARFGMDATGGRFFTLCYATIDLTTGIMEFVCAGHQTPLLYRGGRRVDLGDTHGFPIGIVPDESYEYSRIQLEPGDRIYMYSDGVNEQLSAADEMFGDDRVRTVLADSLDSDAGDAIDGLLSALSEWGGGTFNDDTTVASIDWAG